MRQLPTVILKGCSYVGGSLCRLWVSNALYERARFDVDASRVFLQDVLATITLVGGGTGAREAGARAMCEPWLLFCSVVNTIPWEQKLLGEKP